MATKFIMLTQTHRPKTIISTPKSRRSTRTKPKPTKSITENIFCGTTLAEIYHTDINSHPLTNPFLFLENLRSEKEEETTNNQQEHGKVLNTICEDDKSSITTMNQGDLKRDLARISLLWYMKCSISYILRKARAFYNEFCCDTYLESNNTLVVVDPYFSIPVIH